jgi:hypothetical protein
MTSHISKSAPRAAQPWYREPWPWLLMAGPAIVVVAGVVTTVIAVRTSDGLVADDYYKQGLGINRTIAREERAKALAMAASVRFNEERDHARVALASREATPARLQLTLVHPTRAGEDQSVALARVAPGLYEGRLAPPRSGAWQLRIEDAEGTWRLAGAWQSRADEVTLGEVAR